MTGHELDRIEHVLAAIDGALADPEWPDAMRWSPAPATVADAGPPYSEDPWPLLTNLRGGLRYGRPRPALPDPEAVARFGEALARACADMMPTFNAWAEAITKVAGHWHRVFREAGWLPDAPPTDLRARALHARQHRGTGPARPSGQTAHRPRRHQ